MTSDNSLPLRGVEVRLQSLAGIISGATSTNDAGEYFLKQLGAGVYRLTAEKPGFAGAAYGQTEAFDVERQLKLSDGQILANINLKLVVGGVLQGRITDERKEPVADALVSAVRDIGSRQSVGWLHGEPSPHRVRMGTVHSDDTGHFRLSGLPPAKYFLVVEGKATEAGDGFVRTYYPGTSNIEAARAIDLGKGQQDENLNIPVKSPRRFDISGVVRNSRSAPISQGLLRLGQESQVGSVEFGVGSPGRPQRIRPDGKFTIMGVPEGQYLLVATTGGSAPSAGRGEVMEVGTLGITVGAATHPSSIAIETKPGRTVVGQVIVEDTIGVPVRSVRVFSVPEDSGEVGVFPTASTFADKTGHFKLSSVFGRALIWASGPDLRIKSIYLGDQDITDVGIDTSASLTDGVRVTLTHASTLLSGRATAPNGHYVQDFVALVFAKDEKKWTHPVGRYLTASKADVNGEYSVRGLPAGDYCALAVSHLDPDSPPDPSILRRFAKSAATVRVIDGQNLRQNLLLVSQ